MPISPTNDNRDRDGSLSPVVQFCGQLAAGDLSAFFLKDESAITLAAVEELAAFSLGIGCFDCLVLELGEVVDPLKVLIPAGAGLSEGWLARAEEKPFHDWAGLGRSDS